MKIFKYNGEGGIGHDASEFTRLRANVSNGLATITRRIYFEAEAKNEDAVDILSMEEFPKRYSAHPRHPAYKYYGNAEVQPLSDGSKFWYADLEYATTDPNAKDEDGNSVTSETKPWKLRPDNISFSYPTYEIPFEVSYNPTGRLFDDDGKPIMPVQNSAGEVIPLMRSVRNMQIGFTYATENWDVLNSLKYGNTINAEDIVICGLKIPAKRALLLPPECNYVTVYNDGSNSVKWRYWSVTINIQIDFSGVLLFKKAIDRGNRAIFDTPIDLSEDPLIVRAKSVSPKFNPRPIAGDNSVSSQIIRFNMTTETDEGGGKYGYYPAGQIKFCSVAQFKSVRELYYKASKILMGIPYKHIDKIYEPNFETVTNMPLDGTGRLLLSAIRGLPEYSEETKLTVIPFREYPCVSWASLNMPKKGIKW